VKIRSDCSMATTSCGVAEKLCGSLPAGRRMNTSIYSPTTFWTTSAIMLVVAITFRVPLSLLFKGAQDANKTAITAANSITFCFIVGILHFSGEVLRMALPTVFSNQRHKGHGRIIFMLKSSDYAPPLLQYLTMGTANRQYQAPAGGKLL